MAVINHLMLDKLFEFFVLCTVSERFAGRTELSAQVLNLQNPDKRTHNSLADKQAESLRQCLMHISTQPNTQVGGPAY